MDEARNTGLRGRLGNRLGTFQVDRVERLAAGRGEDADEVDNRVGALDGGGDGVGVAHVGLDGVDLADVAHRLEVARKVGAAHGGADAPTGTSERSHCVAADKTRATENGHQLTAAISRRHVLPDFSRDGRPV